MALFVCLVRVGCGAGGTTLHNTRLITALGSSVAQVGQSNEGFDTIVAATGRIAYLFPDTLVVSSSRDAIGLPTVGC